jgi:hypothetical protein
MNPLLAAGEHAQEFGQMGLIILGADELARAPLRCMRPETDARIKFKYIRPAKYVLSLINDVEPCRGRWEVRRRYVNQRACRTLAYAEQSECLAS